MSCTQRRNTHGPSFFEISARLLIWLGWSLSIVSFSLPATNAVFAPGTPPDGALTGWQAIKVSISVGMHPFALLIYPSSILFLVFIPLNGVMLLTPMLDGTESRMIIPAILIGGTLPWLLPASYLDSATFCV